MTTIFQIALLFLLAGAQIFAPGAISDGVRFQRAKWMFLLSMGFELFFLLILTTATKPSLSTAKFLAWQPVMTSSALLLCTGFFLFSLRGPAPRP